MSLMSLGFKDDPGTAVRRSHSTDVPPVPLAQLRGGERARLLATHLCCDDCDLLNAMGLTDRCELRVCQVGEPCIVQVNSTRLGIARAMAHKIMVERV